MENKITKYIIKHSEKNNENLKYDFMPEILEIIERPANSAGKIIIFSIFTLLVAVVIWSVVAKTDVVVTAQGSITPEGDIVSVQAYSSGTVEKINVESGQYVEQGDLLVQMNSISQQADIANLEKEISILTDEADIYKKIIEGTDVSHISLEEYRDDSGSALKAVLDAENEYNHSLSILENTLKSAEMEYQKASELREKYENDEQYGDLLENQKDVEKQKKIDRDNAELNIENLKSQHSSDLNNSYTKVESRLSELSTELKKIDLSDNYNKIYAPVSGYINAMSVNVKGDIVSSYEEILTILPSDAELQMKAYIKNSDIAGIDLGSEARIKLDAYPYSDYGAVTGTVKSISPDVYAVENIGNVYLLTVELDNENDKIDIISGLSGTVEVKVGERRIISYFIDPLLNVGDEIFKEK